MLATCADLPTGDEDGRELHAACHELGLDVSWQVWDDGTADWQSPDLVVIRSTWDYTPRREEFLAWTRSVRALANPADVVAWNSDKRYLRGLADAGVPTVPTSWSEPGEAVELPVGVDFVVKPAVGAGSVGAGRFAATDPAAPDRARAHAAELHAAGRTVMVQPYLDQVDDAGETALIFFDGVYSHAIRKGAMLPEAVVHPVGPGFSHGLFVTERIQPRQPTGAERAVAEQALAACAHLGPLLYARVDLLPSPDGPVVIELEVVEPSLFLDHAPGSAARLAARIAARVAPASASR